MQKYVLLFNLSVILPAFLVLLVGLLTNTHFVDAAFAASHTFLLLLLLQSLVSGGCNCKSNPIVTVIGFILPFIFSVIVYLLSRDSSASLGIAAIYNIMLAVGFLIVTAIIDLRSIFECTKQVSPLNVRYKIHSRIIDIHIVMFFMAVLLEFVSMPVLAALLSFFAGLSLLLRDNLSSDVILIGNKTDNAVRPASPVQDHNVSDRANIYPINTTKPMTTELLTDEGAISSKSEMEFYEEVYKAIENKMNSNKLYLNHDFNMTDLARVLYTNRTYISRSINYKFKGNFHQYVNSFRVKYSMEIFTENPDMKVSEMAYMSGFNALSSFTVSFKSIVGITPMEWCKEYRLKHNIADPV